MTGFAPRADLAARLLPAPPSKGAPEWAARDQAHSFPAKIAPPSIDARILPDADRLDAIGAIGIARCFCVGGRMGSALYDLAGPAARRRPLDDVIGRHTQQA